MSGHAHIERARVATATTTLTASGEPRTAYERAQTNLMNHTRLALVLRRVGVRTCSVLLTRPDEMMPDCKGERKMYRFYKMAG
ncbi:hypothetical protein RR46_03326 [Papilio xuthus]|uniref:Uncharacterized protein n=1 Tax=Papilio xuthus TaxID=66420 RepID=A0A194Q341_PAPXU|nr:hypothetical protein RR46_03326 [Papilio xuthus]